jgi:hypothetical protein
VATSLAHWSHESTWLRYFRRVSFHLGLSDFRTMVDHGEMSVFKIHLSSLNTWSTESHPYKSFIFVKAGCCAYFFFLWSFRYRFNVSRFFFFYIPLCFYEIVQLPRIFVCDPTAGRTIAKLKDGGGTRWRLTSRSCRTWCPPAVPSPESRTNLPSSEWPSLTWRLSEVSHV